MVNLSALTHLLGQKNKKHPKPQYLYSFDLPSNDA